MAIFYGTIEFGGTVNNNGTVFLIAPNGTPTTLVNFDGFDEGAHPETPLVLGLDGNLYGTTSTGGPGGQGNVFRLSATAAPEITTSPAGQTAFLGGTVSLSIAAYGSQPLAYQWFKNSNRLTDGGNLSGSETRILTITNAVTNNTGNYSVIVTNSFGAATSTVAAVSVLSAGPSIASEPPPKRNRPAGHDHFVRRHCEWKFAVVLSMAQKRDQSGGWRDAVRLGHFRLWNRHACDCQSGASGCRDLCHSRNERHRFRNERRDRADGVASHGPGQYFIEPLLLHRS
jgi:uncharacterized repeat protein (TIGR03803 family)